MSPSGAVEKGSSYLLARFRAREMVSRAPPHSPVKLWDNCGEPFLAIDALLAVGDRIEAEEKEALADRLLRSQFRGAWDYSGKSGVDADTTASAIRALDRLGKKMSLDGLRLFYNPRYQLFNTFAQPLDKLDLQLPPQSPEKHLGSHPCVVANVCLMLRERGELSRLSHDLLRRMQKPDGSWFSYFYPSPFYSTRLFTELLTGLGEEYETYLEATETELLISTPLNSPTQTAEILIALQCLQNRKAAARTKIAEKAKLLGAEILNTQLADGSWPGETIWHFLDRARPFMIVGFDHFRVRSTALCVRALNLWTADPQHS
jgi:hypothetical protein